MSSLWHEQGREGFNIVTRDRPFDGLMLHVILVYVLIIVVLLLLKTDWHYCTSVSSFISKDTFVTLFA